MLYICICQTYTYVIYMHIIYIHIECLLCIYRTNILPSRGKWIPPKST